MSRLWVKDASYLPLYANLVSLEAAEAIHIDADLSVHEVYETAQDW